MLTHSSRRSTSSGSLSRRRSSPRGRPVPFLEPLESRVLLTLVPLGAVGQFASDLVPYKNALYFTAGDGTRGDQLWKTDGTPAGTAIVKDINPNPIASATISDLTVVGDKLVFGANNGVNGPQIWVSDGTPSGTVPLAGTVTSSNGFNAPLAVVNGEAYYVLNQSGNWAIWKTNGTSAGTGSVAALPGGATSYAHPVLIGNRMYITATAFSGGLPFNALYSFNAANSQLTTVVPLAEQKSISELTNAGGVAYYYTGSLTQAGQDLERYDPTGGRVHLADTVSSSSSTNFPGIAAVGGSVYFTADDANGQSRLWVTNGTSAGSRLVDATGNGGIRPINLTVAGGRLFYFAQNSNSIFSLYTTDGTTSTALASVPPSSDLYNTVVDFKGRLLFVGIGNDGNPDLWISDGSTAGTALIQPLDGIAPDNPTRTFLYDIRELELLGNTAVIRSRPNGIQHQLYAVNLVPLLNQNPTGAINDTSTNTVITGHARDLNLPGGNVDIRVNIDGNPNTTFTATTVDAQNGRSFTWYAPPLNTGDHVVDFYAINSWTGDAFKIGTRTLTGDGSLFDERYYLAVYNDVRTAVTSGALPSGLVHFQVAGEKEGREPNAFFRTRYYLDTNPDVKAALAAGSIISAWQHFRDAGQFEKRNPSPFFNTTYYLAQNPDVATRVQATKFSAFQHFIFTGQFEGRNTTPFFNQASYLANNADVKSVVGNGRVSSATQHFIMGGQKESRTYTAPSAFNETAYLAAHSDVAAAVTAKTFASGLEHYLWTGQREGRSLS